MNDEVLIKSEGSLAAKKALRITCCILLIVPVIAILALLLVETSYSYYSSGYYLSGVYISGKSYSYMINGLEAAFRGETPYLPIFIVACALFLIGLIVLVVYLSIGRCELIVTEKNVKGKSLFGKQVVLPMYMVSAYSTRKYLSTIAVATSSGITKFFLVKNYAAIGEVLSKIINERQDKTLNSEKEVVVQQSTAMDDLLKLKNLLDQGIITQEEFEAKKKQLLGV